MESFHILALSVGDSLFTPSICFNMFDRSDTARSGKQAEFNVFNFWGKISKIKNVNIQRSSLPKMLSLFVQHIYSGNIILLHSGITCNLWAQPDGESWLYSQFSIHAWCLMCALWKSPKSYLDFGWAGRVLCQDWCFFFFVPILSCTLISLRPECFVW